MTCEAQDIIDDLDIEEEDRPLAPSLHGDCHSVERCADATIIQFGASQGARWLHMARCPGDPLKSSPNLESSQAADQGRHPVALRSLRQGQQREFPGSFPTSAPSLLRKGAAWPPDGWSHDNQQDEARLCFYVLVFTRERLSCAQEDGLPYQGQRGLIALKCDFVDCGSCRMGFPQVTTWSPTVHPTGSSRTGTDPHSLDS